jgi:hypothetical protein
LLIQRDHLGSGVALWRVALSSVRVLRMICLCCGFRSLTVAAPSGGPRTRGRFGLNGRIGIWRTKRLDARRWTHHGSGWRTAGAGSKQKPAAQHYCDLDARQIRPHFALWGCRIGADDYDENSAGAERGREIQPCRA